MCDCGIGGKFRCVWARTTRRPTTCSPAMGKICRRRFPRRRLTSRSVPAAAMRTSVSRVVVRDGLPQPISSSWTGSAASIKRSLNECRLKDDPFKTTGTEVLNSNDFQQGFCGGPRVDLIRHGDCGYDLELSYFQIDGWSSDRSVGPDHPTDWLVMRASRRLRPNSIERLRTQAMVWEYATQLYNAEFNVRWNPCCRVTMLAGFRWVNLHENLQGALEPPTISWEPPFWNTTTTNNLYGFQIGADGKLFERGRFSIDGLVKAGIFDNNAEQTTEVSIYKTKCRRPLRPTMPPSLAKPACSASIKLPRALAKGRLRSDLAARRCFGTWTDPGNVYCTLTPITVQALASTATPACFITEPPPAWSIRFRNRAIAFVKTRWLDLPGTLPSGRRRSGRSPATDTYLSGFRAAARTAPRAAPSRAAPVFWARRCSTSRGNRSSAVSLITRIDENATCRRRQTSATAKVSMSTASPIAIKKCILLARQTDHAIDRQQRAAMHAGFLAVRQTFVIGVGRTFLIAVGQTFLSAL